MYSRLSCTCKGFVAKFISNSTKDFRMSKNFRFSLGEKLSIFLIVSPDLSNNEKYFSIFSFTKTAYPLITLLK